VYLRRVRVRVRVTLILILTLTLILALALTLTLNLTLTQTLTLTLPRTKVYLRRVDWSREQGAIAAAARALPRAAYLAEVT